MLCQFFFVNVQLQIPDLGLDVSVETYMQFKHGEDFMFCYFLNGMLKMSENGFT